MSGRLTVIPKGSRHSCNWPNNQGLAANPPTSHTDCDLSVKSERKRRQKWCYLDKTTCCLYLLFDRGDGSFYGRFEELRNFGPRNNILVDASTNSKSDSPCQLQLTVTDTDAGILIKRRTKLNILNFFLITEQTLCRFIKALGDMLYSVLCAILGTAELILHADEGWLRTIVWGATNLRRTHEPFD